MLQYINDYDITLIKKQLPTLYEILDLFSAGHTRKYISTHLHISGRQLSYRLRYGRVKYDCNTTYELMYKVTKAGVLND